MDKVIDNEMLKRALEIYEDRRLSEYDSLKSFTPSKEFEKRMESLIKSSGKHYQAKGVGFRKILAIAAAAAVLATCAMSVTAVRESILGFFFSRGGEVDVIEYNKDKSSDYPKELKMIYELSYLPSGYKLENKTSDKTSSEFYYVKKENNYIDFQQYTKDSYASASDGEFSNPKKIKNNGQNYIIRTSEDSTTLVWEKDGYVFEMTGFESRDEMFKIARSAAPKGE